MKAVVFARMIVLAAACIVVTACAESQFLIHTAKIVNQTNDAVPSQGRYKIGNPYEINGTWYYPKVNYEYDETGIASWYGPNFHGKLTANGETYDMNALTAAHRTLPLPTWVEVTNLENGRKLNLRINDRGPYAKGRIIDISRQGAQLLGFQTNGTAKIRVRVLAEESLALVRQLTGEATIAEVGSPITVESVPTEAVDTEPLAPPDGAAIVEASANPVVVTETSEPPSNETVSEPVTSPSEPEVQVVEVVDTGIFIQAGAFSQYENANRVQATLTTIGEVNISQILVNDLDLYRVRLGPISNVTEADILLSQVIGAGYPDARIIVD